MLLPTERDQTLTGLANTTPDVGAQEARAQSLQWCLSECNSETTSRVVELTVWNDSREIFMERG